MSDHMAAEITIGGKLSSEEGLDALLDAVRGSGASRECGGGCFQPASWEEIETALDDEGRLRLFDDSARWGEFEGLEATCLELRLYFVRRSEAKYDCDAEVVFSSGDGSQELVTTNASGQPTITVEKLLGVIRDSEADPHAAIASLKSLVPPPVPDVPRLELRRVVQPDAKSSGEG